MFQKLSRKTTSVRKEKNNDSSEWKQTAPVSQSLLFAIDSFLALQHLDQSHSRRYEGQRRACRLVASLGLPCPITAGAFILGCCAATNLPFWQSSVQHRQPVSHAGEDKSNTQDVAHNGHNKAHYKKRWDDLVLHKQLKGLSYGKQTKYKKSSGCLMKSWNQIM